MRPQASTRRFPAAQRPDDMLPSGKHVHPLLLSLLVILRAGAVVAAAEEEAPGRSAGCPAGRALKQAYQERPPSWARSARWTASNRRVRWPPAARPLPLRKAATEAPIRCRFAGRMLTHGQAVFVDPVLRLVVVQSAVGKDASGDASGAHLGAERDALLRGIVAGYGDW